MPQSRHGGSYRFLAVAAVILAVGVGFALFMRNVNNPRGGLGPGTALPPIRVEGWLNGPGPTPDAYKGKVLVVDAWAYWCGPCLAMAPEIVSAYEKHRDRSVVFIGLTGDPGSDALEMKHFLEEAHVTWPCGYGAIGTLQALRANLIPQIWVVGRNGVIRWNLDESGTLDEAIETALAENEGR